MHTQLGFLSVLSWASSFFLALGACTTAPAAEFAQTAPGPNDFQVHYIDVGSGDCIWIHTGDDGIPGNGKLEGYNILIDGGDAPSFGHVDGYATALKYLTEDDKLPKGSTIDWMVLSHPHSDHCGGLDNFLDEYDVLNILDPGADEVNSDGVPKSQRPRTMYGKFFLKASTEVVNGAKANYIWGIPDDLVLDWGSELEVKILHSSSVIHGTHVNDTSIVFSLGFTDPTDGPTFLFTGDAEKGAEIEMLAEHGAALKADVLKAGHHGSKTSSTDAFLRAVQPKHFVVSSGNRKFSGTMLPSQSTLDRVMAISAELGLGTTIWRTDRGDKTPTMVPEKEEAGDDTVVAWVSGGVFSINYFDLAGADDTGSSDSALDSLRCQAITNAGTQCKRARPDGEDFCWQHD